MKPLTPMSRKRGEAWWERYKSTVPEGCVGEWSIQRYTVNAEDRELKTYNLRASFTPGGRLMRPGSYTRLVRGEALWMSDTPQEITDHILLFNRAERGGRVLMHGLGLGMSTEAVIRTKGVTSVDVVELHSEVIALVEPHLAALADAHGVELHIHEGDAYTFTFERGRHWEIVWHDIWPDINTNNLVGLGKLKRRYGRRADWQQGWVESLLRTQQRRERTQPWAYN